MPSSPQWLYFSLQMEVGSAYVFVNGALKSIVSIPTPNTPTSNFMFGGGTYGTTFGGYLTEMQVQQIILF